MTDDGMRTNWADVTWVEMRNLLLPGVVEVAAKARKQSGRDESVEILIDDIRDELVAEYYIGCDRVHGPVCFLSRADLATDRWKSYCMGRVEKIINEGRAAAAGIKSNTQS